METNRSIYGGGVLINGNAEVTLLGFNPDGNPVLATVPIGKLLNTVTHLSDKFAPVQHAAAAFCYTNDGKVMWTLVDDKLKQYTDVIPIEKCWAAIEQVGKFTPVNRSQIAA